MARAVTRPTACSFIGKGNIICLESRGKEDVIHLAECIAEVRNHLKSCHLSRTKVTEYELRDTDDVYYTCASGVA